MINVIRNSNTGIPTRAAGLLTSVIISITFFQRHQCVGSLHCSGPQQRPNKKRKKILKTHKLALLLQRNLKIEILGTKIQGIFCSKWGSPGKFEIAIKNTC